jgi:hypothetical protein
MTNLDCCAMRLSWNWIGLPSMASNVSIAKQICVIKADHVHCEVQARNLPGRRTRVYERCTSELSR